VSFDNYSLGIFITGDCNKNCEYCCYDIKYREPFTFNDDSYQEIVNNVDCDKYTFVYLSGGEPLLYPEINELVPKILRDFPNAEVSLRTNGKLLDSYKWTGKPRIQVQISEYPGWNDEVVKRYSNTTNVKVIPYKGFVDFNDPANLGDVDARTSYDRCYKFLWVKDGKVYECCGSSIPEYKHGLKGVSMPLEEWSDDKIHLLRTVRACKLCVLGTVRYKEGRKGPHYDNTVDGGHL